MRLASCYIKLTIAACLFLLFFNLPTPAQITNVTNDQSTPIPGAGHDYIRMLSETVNPANGSVSLRIQLPVSNGRQLSISIGFAHDTNGVHHLTSNPNGSPIWAVDPNPYSSGGWSYSLPMLSDVYGTKVVGTLGHQSTCAWYSGFVFQDPTGGRHALGISSAEPYNAGSCQYPATAVPNAGDDYYRASTLPAFTAPNAKVASVNSLVYTFGNNPSGCPTACLANTIEDRNGNIISITANSQGGTTLTDTLNRALFSSSSFASSSGDTINVSGLPNPFIVNWKTVTSNFTTPVQPITAQGCSPSTNTDQRSEISTITLPNGQKYTFLYGTDDPNNSNAYGLLSEIVYPSGGWVKYAYGMNSTSDAFLINTTP